MFVERVCWYLKLSFKSLEYYYSCNLTNEKKLEPLHSNVDTSISFFYITTNHKGHKTTVTLLDQHLWLNCSKTKTQINRSECWLSRMFWWICVLALVYSLQLLLPSESVPMDIKFSFASSTLALRFFEAGKVTARTKMRKGSRNDYRQLPKKFVLQGIDLVALFG